MPPGGNVMLYNFINRKHSYIFEKKEEKCNNIQRFSKIKLSHPEIDPTKICKQYTPYFYFTSLQRIM